MAPEGAQGERLAVDSSSVFGLTVVGRAAPPWVAPVVLGNHFPISVERIDELDYVADRPDDPGRDEAEQKSKILDENVELVRSNLRR